MIDLEKLTPFQFFALTNFPYIEADFDALTNYQLFCEITKYLNGISSSQNDVISNFNELLQNWNDFSEALTSEWTETKDYIDNYFDNLDVQEEINNKLDQMASDGSLLAVIQSTVIGEARTITENWLAQLTPETEVIIDTTLTTAGACADAKATGDAISDVKGAIDNIIRPVNYLDRTKVLYDKYLSGTGAVYDYANFGITDYIPISEDETIKLSIASPSNLYHCLYDEDYNFLSSVTADNTSVTGTATSKYVRFTIRTNRPSLMIYKGNLPNRFIPYSPINGFIGEGYKIDPLNHIETQDFILQNKLSLVSTTFTQNSIFEEEITNAVTSDYIEIDNQSKTYYFIGYTNYSVYYDLVRFYDKDKNQIGNIPGGLTSDMLEIPLKLVLPNSCQYIKFSQYASGVSAGAGIYRGYFTTFEKSVAEVVSSYNTENNNVLWIGTSIPEGATYPRVACNVNGYNCLNKSLGSSKLCFENEYISGADNTKGRRLTATVAELESLYRADVTAGIITEDTLNQWKNYSYENSIIPYIDGTNATQVSMIVLDHGYNDRATIHEQMQNVSGIDWTSTDRSTFTGAFKYLLNKIQEVNPFIKIVISGYFTNTVERLAFSYYSAEICEMQTMIGEYYDISVMKAWEHTQINPIHVSGTDDYISNFNTEYGTSYTKITPDASGNITALQLYCPDGVHPHSDLTGNCNKRLNAIYTKLLAHMI